MSGVRSGKELDPYLRARIGDARFNIEKLILPFEIAKPQLDISSLQSF